MTKPLTKAQKKEKKDARKSQQQKAPSTTKTTVNVPKAAPPTEDPVNLCDTCAFEFGECEGTPKFGDEDGADNVVECKTWTNVDDFPTADQGKAAAPGPAAAVIEQGPGPRVCDVEHLRDYPECFEDCPKDTCDGIAAAATHDGDDNPPNEPGGDQGDEADLVHTNEVEGATEEDQAEDLATMRADLPDRPDPKRFLEDTTNFGACPGCERPLKRTALNRYRDAIRCTNPRCPQYRAVVKTVGTGV